MIDKLESLVDQEALDRLRIPCGWTDYFSTNDCIKFNVEPVIRETMDWYAIRQNFFDLLQSYVHISHMNTWWDYMKRSTMTGILANEWDAMKKQGYCLLFGEDPTGIAGMITQTGAHCADIVPPVFPQGF